MTLTTAAILRALPTHTVATWTHDGNRHAAKLGTDGRWNRAYTSGDGVFISGGIVNVHRFARTVDAIDDIDFADGTDDGDPKALRVLADE